MNNETIDTNFTSKEFLICVKENNVTYSGPGVFVVLDSNTPIKQAAAFLGAIAMMLDGQALS